MTGLQSSCTVPGCSTSPLKELLCRKLYNGTMSRFRTAWGRQEALDFCSISWKSSSSLKVSMLHPVVRQQYWTPSTSNGQWCSTREHCDREMCIRPPYTTLLRVEICNFHSPKISLREVFLHHKTLGMAAWAAYRLQTCTANGWGQRTFYRKPTALHTLLTQELIRRTFAPF